MESKLNILVASINFAPDHAGIGVYSTDFPVYLAERGDTVTMVTGFPYYPHWRKQTKDSGAWFRRETYKGVDVRRGYLFVPRKVSTLKRLWHEFTFCTFAWINFFRAGRPDVMVLFTPPFFLGMVGLFWKWIWRRPLVINIQDLPLEAALALGMMKRNLLSNLFLAIESWIYRRADLVVSISPVMLDAIRAKGVKESRLMLCPNWIDVTAVRKPVEALRFSTVHPEGAGKFTVAYAGNLGVKQGVDILLHAAKAVANMPDVHFFVIGDGADRIRLMALAHKLQLSNCTFLPFMNSEDYGAMLTEIDLIFVAQRSGAGNNFFPSKLLGLMARAKPLLVAADPDSELALMISTTGCGLVCAYDDPSRLIANLKTMKARKASNELGLMGAKGLGKVSEFDRSKVLGAWRARIATLQQPQPK